MVGEGRQWSPIGQRLSLAMCGWAELFFIGGQDRGGSGGCGRSGGSGCDTDGGYVWVRSGGGGRVKGVAAIGGSHCGRWVGSYSDRSHYGRWTGSHCGDGSLWRLDTVAANHCGGKSLWRRITVAAKSL
ncbi:unnamed protein product [Cuscuta europaea]|uniref:Uncharacterized protein n=1 Tax=Cuscuta europaea TaxID=41803 RepID=A0A9P1DYP0_CUSEU|nr:unnamed protein product [Cuscuta europaea]